MDVTTDVLEYCRSIRRHLHRFPELGFKEEKTCEYILAKLDDLGIEGKRVAGTGVYVVIDSGRPGPVLAFRADIDALPIQEESDVPYTSTVPGVMHACGHDGHTAILLGLASMLQRHRDSLKGKIMLLFQPAEENPPGGARPIIESGILEGVESIFGLHIVPLMPLGIVGIRPGPMMSALSEFTVKISGAGGHASLPHLCVDPIVTGAQLVCTLQTVVSRRVDPVEPALLTVGRFSAGTVSSTIPGSAELSGCIHCHSEMVLSSMESDLRQMAEGVCGSVGASVSIDLKRQYPVLVNDERLTSLIEETAGQLLGSGNVARVSPVMACEDFAYYGRICPSVFFILGGGNPEKGFVYQNHNPRFDFDEEAMPLGIQIFLGAMERMWEK
ncbi:MAG: amidohydrolase [Deltaproteobacteria bacterium]|nr:amidohydrolase [Deltaproteobacteria bacterium]